jgi:predicted RNA-binding protein YlxR (DUF448 family)
VCRDESCVDLAIARGGLARALGTNIPADIQHELKRIVSRGIADGAQ